ncbi:DUF2169 family type VI secretion system accessory protein [Variovorax sp. CCNWLW235]|uniref:DUF2169 family type VI secretion system accessory protein n=1 Tax=Variovorax sp. CCNWLW235 TaxID=3127463 RepID=UPI0030770D25
MEFRNLTPFDAMCFRAATPSDREYRVVAMKIGYRLVRGRHGQWQAEVNDDRPVPLTLADEYWGEEGASSPREESDLAPYKPRCDVIVNAIAHAPCGVPASDWEVRVKVTARPQWLQLPQPPRPLHPGARLTPRQQQEWDSETQRAQALAAPRAVLDKRLRISGPAVLYRRDKRNWERTPPEAIASLPMRWEYALGGRSLLRRAGAPKDEPPLLDEVCFSNPLGRGWIEQRELEEARSAGQPEVERIAAPQIEAAGVRMRQPVIARHASVNQDARTMAETARSYGETPAGLGVVGRAWAPRLALAGTYDDAWLEQRHPWLPKDFDFGYWNAAPVDQQIPYLPPDACIELWNLSDPATTPEGHLSVTLPGHRALVLARLDNGALLPLPMVTDTLLIDTQAMALSLVHRTWIPSDAPVRVVEARFETDPQAPLVRSRNVALNQ